MAARRRRGRPACNRRRDRRAAAVGTAPPRPGAARLGGGGRAPGRGGRRAEPRRAGREGHGRRQVGRGGAGPPPGHEPAIPQDLQATSPAGGRRRRGGADDRRHGGGCHRPPPRTDPGGGQGALGRCRPRVTRYAGRARSSAGPEHRRAGRRRWRPAPARTVRQRSRRPAARRGAHGRAGGRREHGGRPAARAGRVAKRRRSAARPGPVPICRGPGAAEPPSCRPGSRPGPEEPRQAPARRRGFLQRPAADATSPRSAGGTGRPRTRSPGSALLPAPSGGHGSGPGVNLAKQWRAVTTPLVAAFLVPNAGQRGLASPALRHRSPGGCPVLARPPDRLVATAVARPGLTRGRPTRWTSMPSSRPSSSSESPTTTTQPSS